MNAVRLTPAQRPSTVERLVGTRRLQLLLILTAGVGAGLAIGLKPHDLIPSAGGWKVIGNFLAGAVAPAVTYEAQFLPAGTSAFGSKLATAIWHTIIFAVAAISLSIPAGMVLGVLSSTRLHTETTSRVSGTSVRDILIRGLCWTARVFTALIRSIHELLWAVLFLAAIGLSNLAAVLAIAIPYSGVLARIFSEMIDEAPRETADLLRSSGASGLQVFAFGILPRAIPDMLAYACYRFECALRSSAVLGFFGIPTIGYHLHLAFQNGHYRETWTYLYAIAALVALADWWSGAMRRRLVV